MRYLVIGDAYRSVEVRMNVRLFAIAPGEDAIGREASGPKLRSGWRCIHAVPSEMVADTTTAAFVVADVRVGSEVPLSASDPGRSTAFLISLPLARKGIDNWNACVRWRRRQRGEGLRERLGPRGM